jgi:hypothetical protein
LKSKNFGWFIKNDEKYSLLRFPMKGTNLIAKLAPAPINIDAPNYPPD